ncbi:MAG: hypothetical protein JSR17_00985 [Proteobacteria bacterium]|nr:hypothetical protein [Pseudomonadota bacterium]
MPKKSKQRGGDPKIIKIAGEKAWKYEMKVGEKLIFNKENKNGREWSADADSEYFDYHSYQKNNKITFTLTAKKDTEYTLIILVEHSVNDKEDVFVEPIVVEIKKLTSNEVKEIKSDVKPIMTEAKDSLKAVREDIKGNMKKIKYVDCPSITDCMKREFIEIDADIANAIERIRKLEKQVGDMLIPMASEQRYEEAEKEAKRKGFDSYEEYQKNLAKSEKGKGGLYEKYHWKNPFAKEQETSLGFQKTNTSEESAARVAGVSVEEYRRLQKEKDEIAPDLDISVYLDAKRAGMTFKPPMLALEYLDYRNKANKLGVNINEYLKLEQDAEKLGLTVEQVIKAQKQKDEEDESWFFGGYKKNKSSKRNKKNRRHN